MKDLLLKVNKPARYSGGEYNTPSMNKPDALKVCLCFPDVYEVGMSNLGIKILYHMLNEQPDIRCERCFAPWPDMGGLLREEKLPLSSLETKTPLKGFDIVGFSVQYELCYTNLLYMLELAGIPFYSAERGEEYPLIVSGGPCALNCEPIAPFFDLFMIGDGEESLMAVCKLYEQCRAEGKSKREYLEQAARIEGVYVPAFVDVSYREDGRIQGFDVKYPIRRAVVRDLDAAYFPTAQIVPNVEAVHDRGTVELFRGCSRGCRFCQAGFTYRPIRERKPDTIVRQCKDIILQTGYGDIGMSSLSTGDYPYLKQVVREMKPFAEKHRVNLSLPSMRADSFQDEFAFLAKKSSLTFAPEAGTQRLRDVINKNITEADIESCLTAAFQLGYSTVKLYFMLGLPTETDEDVLGIAEIVEKCKRLFREHRTNKKELRISVSASTFVPKPFTPFQWEPQDTRENLARKQQLLIGALRQRGVSFAWSDYYTAYLEAVFARGDRRLADTVVRAYRKGCMFDGWTEYFREDLWREAIAESGVNTELYTGRHGFDDVLPWDYFDSRISKKYLRRECELAYRGEVTPDCRKGCRGCGANADGLCEVANALKSKAGAEPGTEAGLAEGRTAEENGSC